jgi:hypothetical protein
MKKPNYIISPEENTENLADKMRLIYAKKIIMLLDEKGVFGVGVKVLSTKTKAISVRYLGEARQISLARKIVKMEHLKEDLKESLRKR